MLLNTASFIKTVPSVYIFLMNTIYRLNSTQADVGTIFMKHKELPLNKIKNKNLRWSSLEKTFLRRNYWGRVRKAAKKLFS